MDSIAFLGLCCWGKRCSFFSDRINGLLNFKRRDPIFHRCDVHFDQLKKLCSAFVFVFVFKIKDPAPRRLDEESQA